MATERQVEANRRNAARSTGPKTEAGKARSRANATRHGLAGESSEVEADSSPEFLDRRAKWAAGREPADEAGRWALDRAVAASIRVERCEQALDRVVALESQRAALCWDQDRALEAEQVAASLAKQPALASRRLQTSLAGVDWLIEAWLGLLDILDDGKDWSTDQASRAYDLLGIPPDRRDEATPTAELDQARMIEIRRDLAMGEVERLESLRDGAFLEIDEAERAIAMGGGRAMLSKPARLILRYERDAWRRYRESIRPFDSPPSTQPAPRSATPEPTPTPTPTRPARPAARVEPTTVPSLESLREGRRSLYEAFEALGVKLSGGIGPDPGDDDPDGRRNKANFGSDDPDRRPSKSSKSAVEARFRA